MKLVAGVKPDHFEENTQPKLTYTILLLGVVDNLTMYLS